MHTYGVRILITKSKFHQYLLRANSPNLMLAKLSRYTVVIFCAAMTQSDLSSSGDTLHNIILTSSAFPSHIGASNLSILAIDGAMERITETVKVSLSKYESVLLTFTCSPHRHSKFSLYVTLSCKFAP